MEEKKNNTALTITSVVLTVVTMVAIICVLSGFKRIHQERTVSKKAVETKTSFTCDLKIAGKGVSLDVIPREVKIILSNDEGTVEISDGLASETYQLDVNSTCNTTEKNQEQKR